MAAIASVGSGRLVKAVEGNGRNAVIVERINAIELMMLYGVRVAAMYLRANGWSLCATRKILLGL